MQSGMNDLILSAHKGVARVRGGKRARWKAFSSAAFEVTAERMQFLSSGKHEGENDGDHQEAGIPAAEEENIPF